MARGRRDSEDSEESNGNDEKTLSQQFMGQIGLPAFIISTFFPQIMHQLGKYPRLVRFLSLPLALWVGSEFLWKQLFTLWTKLMSTAMTSIKIDSQDGQLHSSLRRFLQDKKLMQSHREMAASSTHFLRHHVNGGHYHIRHIAAGTNVVYDALNTFQFFWHDGRLFVLTVDRKFKQLRESDLTIWTFGWSPDPIQKILDNAFVDANKEDGKVTTPVLVPGPGARNWQGRSSKPRRPLDSVYLAEGQKQMLLKDMEEYLNKDTVRWYEERGIPHRRGYMFHGKPGTGKTTLALALAGQFKLNVYILSLLDNDIDDNTLLNLFTSIGQGSLVLLEDVDVAGLENRPKPESKAKRRAGSKMGGKVVATEASTGVTLSGLLNAIDGAGAPEGHILIMTSNQPESLDEALVRAGRVDVWVEFRNAARSQVRDIFNNMYHPSTGQKEQSSTDTAEEGSESSETSKVQSLSARQQEVHFLAEKFADIVPAGQFSPAELQDYLILHKNKPQLALDRAGAWVAEKVGVSRVGTPDGATDSIASDSDHVFSENVYEHSTSASSNEDESIVSTSETKHRKGLASRLVKGA